MLLNRGEGTSDGRISEKCWYIQRVIQLHFAAKSRVLVPLRHSTMSYHSACADLMQFPWSGLWPQRGSGPGLGTVPENLHGKQFTQITWHSGKHERVWHGLDHPWIKLRWTGAGLTENLMDLIGWLWSPVYSLYLFYINRLLLAKVNALFVIITVRSMEPDKFQICIHFRSANRLKVSIIWQLVAYNLRVRFNASQIKHPDWTGSIISFINKNVHPKSGQKIEYLLKETKQKVLKEV